MNKISPREFVNVNIAFAGFLDGERIGQESIDTSGNEYVWAGTVLGWIQTSTNAASHVQTQAGSTNAYGAHPADRPDLNSGTGVNAADVLFNTADSSGKGRHVIEVRAGAIDLTVSLNGTDYSAVSVQSMKDDATRGTWVTGTALPTGVFLLLGDYRKIKAVQNGATAATANMRSYAGG